MEPLIQYDLMGCKCLTGLTPGENDHPMWLFRPNDSILEGCGRFSRVSLTLVGRGRPKLEVMAWREESGFYVILQSSI